jgi:hypothetical protein
MKLRSHCAAALKLSFVALEKSQLMYIERITYKIIITSEQKVDGQQVAPLSLSV